MDHRTTLLRQLRRAIGRNIHEIRAAQKMPLKKLARQSGVPEHLLDQYELGKNQIELHALLKISLALGKELPELLQSVMRQCPGIHSK